MKTRSYKFILALIFLLTGIIGVSAQSLYYAGQTIKGDGFTYICETPWAESGATLVVFPGDIRLRNVNNTFTGIAQRSRGALVATINAPKSYNNDGDVFKKFHKIINSTLNSTDKQNAKEAVLIIELHINSQTGKIMDVEFYMNIDNGFAKIVPEKYYQIETQLKQQVTYQINSIGAEYSYNYDFLYYKGVFLGQTLP